MSVVLEEVNIGSSANNGYIYTASSPAENPGNSFRFPYYAASDLGVVKDVADTSRNIYITKISNNNLYYFNTNYGGKSGAIQIDNADLIKGLNKKDYKAISSLNKGTVLANCVGWAHSRLLEVWGTAKSSGYIKKVDGNWVIPSKNNLKITCAAEPTINNVPRTDAYLFYKRWPNTEGWYKSIESQDNLRPLPGCIICWKNMNTSDGKYGHVAFVEAVFNYGQSNEYIVVSQSYYNKNGAKTIATTQVINRSDYAHNAPYAFNRNYKFLGFLYSPVCQLLPIGGYYATSQQTYTAEEIEVLKADQKVYKNITEGLENTSTVNKDFIKGQKVRIVWFGSTTPNDTGDRLNLLDGVGEIVKVNKLKTYPYAVSLTGDKVISGYFPRESLKIEE